MIREHDLVVLTLTDADLRPMNGAEILLRHPAHHLRPYRHPRRHADGGQPHDHAGPPAHFHEEAPHPSKRSVGDLDLSADLHPVHHLGRLPPALHTPHVRRRTASSSSSRTGTGP